MVKKIYVCGPTVYNNPHIGNLRPIITFDIFIRSLRFKGKKVNFIHNITDIDDKIIKKSIEENVSEKEIADRYTNVYKQLLLLSNVETPTSMPTVTGYMKQIIEFISELINSGAAYESKGNVYFDVTNDKKYGHISNRILADMIFEENAPGKRNPADFAVWKKTNIGILFDSPWGKGRPGWHTECATFIQAINGVDIHGGGIDLRFPHHENEAAQFRMINNNELAQEWKHTGHINFEGIKMSKSIGNILDATQFIEKYGGKLLRMIFLTSSITAPINITDQLINSTIDKVNKFIKAAKMAQLITTINVNLNTIANEIINWKFSDAMKILNANLKAFNSNKSQANELLANLQILGLLEKTDILSTEDKELYKTWEKACDEKEYVKADGIREQLIIKKII